MQFVSSVRHVHPHHAAPFAAGRSGERFAVKLKRDAFFSVTGEVDIKGVAGERCGFAAFYPDPVAVELHRIGFAADEKEIA